MSRLTTRSLPFTLLALLVAGCAGTPRMAEKPEPAIDPAAPRVLLAGAELNQARAVAMGAAADKGWRIAESADDLIVMQRPLSAAAAESVAPGASLGSVPPRVEVRANLLPAPGGTEVVLQAEVLTADPKGAEVRRSYTGSYRRQLEQSLASLQRVWETSDWRIAGALPPVPPPAPPADLSAEPSPALTETPVGRIAETQPLPPLSAVSSPAAVPPAVSRPPVPATPATAASRPVTTATPPVAKPPATAAVTAPGARTTTPPAGPAATGARTATAAGTAVAKGALAAPGKPAATAAPVASKTAPPPAKGTAAPPVKTAAAPVAKGATTAPPPKGQVAQNEMLRLKKAPATVVWAYYAEHYARVRGCKLAGDGAVLLKKSEEFEEHRVYCEGGKTFLVRCNAGTCRGLN